jgi:hypothetical protein
MTITLNTKEFDEAVLLWLQSQGFSTDRFSINTKLTVGRGDLGAGTRMEVTLDPITTTIPSGVFTSMGMVTPVVPSADTSLSDFDIAVATSVARPDPFKTGPSFSRGHADE